MIEDKIDTFRNTTPALSQKYVQKSQIERSNCHNAYNLKFDVNHVFSVNAILLPNVKKFSHKQRENEHFTIHAVSFKTLISET